MSAKKDKKAGKPSEENKKRGKKPAKPLKMADGEKIPNDNRNSWEAASRKNGVKHIIYVIGRAL